MFPSGFFFLACKYVCCHCKSFCQLLLLVPPFFLPWLFVGLPPSLPPSALPYCSSSFNLFVCSSTEAEGPLHLFWSGGRVNRGAPEGLVGPVATRPDPQTWPSSPLAGAKTREGALGGARPPSLTRPPSPAVARV